MTTTIPLASSSLPLPTKHEICRCLSPSKSLISSNLCVKLRLPRSYGCRERVHTSPSPRASTQSTAAENFDERSEGVEEEEISRSILIWRGIKLPFYSAAFVPLTVGSAAAYLHTGLFNMKRYLVLLLSSFLIIAWLILSNDFYDFQTGVDKDKKESLVNLIGSSKVIIYAANSLLGLGFIGLLWASAEAGDLRSIYLLSCAIMCGYIYQCPPFRLSYQGLGEPLCFAAFGPFSTSAFYLLQGCKSDMRVLPITATILSASLLVGMTSSMILFCSHFHQIDGDQAAGKMSPLVRIGTKVGSEVVKVAITMLYFLLVALCFSKALPWTCVFFCAMTLPMGKMVTNFVEENHSDKIKIFMAKYYCLRLNLLFGIALAVGLFVARYVA